MSRGMMKMEEKKETVIDEVMTKSYFHLKPDDLIDKAVHVFSETDIHSLLLIDDTKRVRGVVSAINVLNRMKETLKLKNIAVSPPLLHENAKDFSTIAKKLIGSDLNLLPVVNKHEQVLGVVSLRGLTRLLLETSPIQEGDIEDYMEEIDPGETINENDSIERVLSLMKKYNTANLPVIRGEEIIGMIRPKELFKESGKQERGTRGKFVVHGGGERKTLEVGIASLVTDPAILVLTETKLVKDAVDLMYENNSDFIIIEDEGGKPKGKLTMKSLLGEMIAADERGIAASDLVRVDGAPDEEIALICLRKAETLFEKFGGTFGPPRDALISFKKIQYQSKRGMFLCEVTIKMVFDKKGFHSSATDFGSRKSANVAFIKLGRTLRDYRSKLHIRYQRTAVEERHLPVEEGMTGTFPISVLKSPDTNLSSRIKEQLNDYMEMIDLNLVGGSVMKAVVEFKKVEEESEADDIAWTCIMEINFPAKSFSKTITAQDPDKAFDQAFEAIAREINQNS